MTSSILPRSHLCQRCIKIQNVPILKGHYYELLDVFSYSPAGRILCRNLDTWTVSLHCGRACASSHIPKWGNVSDTASTGMAAPPCGSACALLDDPWWRSLCHSVCRCVGPHPCGTECEAAAPLKTEMTSRTRCTDNSFPPCASACVLWSRFCWNPSHRWCTCCWALRAAVGAVWVNNYTGIPCCTGCR